MIKAIDLKKRNFVRSSGADESDKEFDICELKLEQFKISFSYGRIYVDFELFESASGSIPVPNCKTIGDLDLLIRLFTGKI